MICHQGQWKGMFQTSVHLPIFWTLWALPKITILIPKYIPRSVGVVTNSFHSFRKTVVILERLRSNAKWAKTGRESVNTERLLLTSSYCDQRPISNELLPVQVTHRDGDYVYTAVWWWEQQTIILRWLVTIRAALRPLKKPLPLPPTIYRPPKIYLRARTSWYSNRDGGTTENLGFILFYHDQLFLLWRGFLIGSQEASMPQGFLRFWVELNVWAASLTWKRGFVPWMFLSYTIELFRKDPVKESLGCLLKGGERNSV